MRVLRVGWLYVELGSVRWKGAPEFGVALSLRGSMWTWRHRQGLFWYFEQV